MSYERMPRKPPKPGKPPVIKVRDRKFGSTRGNGSERVWRVEFLIPLDRAETALVKQKLRDGLRALKKRRPALRLFFVSFLIRTKGQLYQSKLITEPANQMSYTWMSTHVMSNLKKLGPEISRILEKVDIELENRAGWVVGMRIVLFKYVMPNSERV